MFSLVFVSVWFRLETAYYEKWEEKWHWNTIARREILML